MTIGRLLPVLVALGITPGACAGGGLVLSQDGLTVYDTVNNITWLANGNLSGSNRFGLPLCSGPSSQPCVNASGSMSYTSAAAWVGAMNAADYLGHSDWQLPATPLTDPTCSTVGPNGGSFAFSCTGSAMGFLYNSALSLRAPGTAVPIPSNTVGPFSNLQPYLYWTQTSAGGNGYYTFSFDTGWQGNNVYQHAMYVLPMIPGKLPGSPAATGMSLQINPGGQTVYDPVSNVTWLANANLAATNPFGLPACTAPNTPATCVVPDGAMSWNSAQQFIANMNSANGGAGYLGQKNWQLPQGDTSCSGYNCSSAHSPMGELFYNQMGLSKGMPAVTTPDIPVGPFHNIQPYLYWSCQASTIRSACSTDVPSPNFEWSFSFGNGFQGTDILQNDLFATAYFVCGYALNLSGQAFSAQGGSGAIAITTGTGCPWTLSNLPAWVIPTSATSGVGNGTVTFQVGANTGGDQSASLVIGGQTFTVEQTAASIPGLASAGSLAQVVSAGTWGSRLTAINLGTSAAEARFTFTSDGGSTLPLPFTFPQIGAGPLLAPTLDRTLNPNAQVILDTTGPDSTATQQGWGQLQTNGGISGFGIFNNPGQAWSAVVPLETRNAGAYYLAFDNTGAIATGVAIANLSGQSAAVNVTIRDDTGKTIDGEVLSLGPQGHTAFMLNQKYGATAGKRGTVEFDTPAGGQISVLGLRANGAALTTLPVLANAGAGGGSITHVTYNGGYTSVFYIVNTGAAAGQFTLSFYDESGTALAVPLVLPQTGTNTTTSALTQTLAAGAMVVVQTQAQNGPVAVWGSAQLVGTVAAISGFEIFSWNTYGQEASVPLETRTPNSFVLVFDDTGGLTTGVAVANLSNGSANVSVNLRDDQGVLLGTGTITLAGRGHTAFLLPVNYPVTAGVRGMAEFVVPGGGKISVIGLRANTSNDLTTIPVLVK